MTTLLSATEAQVHEAICDYIRLKYPSAVFWSDGSGNNLSHVQAARNTALRSSRGIPDIFVAVPKGKYAGLAIEVKSPDAKIYLADGVTLSRNPHIQEQAEVLTKLIEAGYYGNFCVGYDEGCRLIDWYFSRN